MRHPSRLALALLAVTAAGPAPAAPPAAGDVLPIWPGRAPRATADDDAQTPTLTCFPPAPGTATGAACVVCPGGGYTGLMMGHEGTDVARWLAAHGVYAAVLKYRVNVPQPAPMLDGQRAVRFLRFHATDWGVDRHRIGLLGFSAGGHVASTVGTHWDTGIPKTHDPVQDESCRPDFLVLGYPVITMQAGLTHPGSRHVLLGDRPADKLVALYSNEQQVTKDTPPTFVFASKTDDVVPVRNSELFADALRKRKVPVELLEFPTGGHGYGMAVGHPELDWTDPCLAWMKGQGLLTPAKAKPAK